MFEQLNTQPTRRDILQFGVIFAIGMSCVGLGRYWLGSASSPWGPIAVGAIGCLLSFVPGLGRWMYIAWMGLGLVIGAITGPIFLLVIYAFVIVPFGAILRLANRPPLDTRPRTGQASYWQDCTPVTDRRRYWKQY